MKITSKSDIRLTIKKLFIATWIWIFIIFLFPFDFDIQGETSLAEIFKSDNIVGWKSSSEVLLNFIIFSLMSFSLTGLIDRKNWNKSLQTTLVFIFSLILALAGEILQLFLPSRIPSITDIIICSFGGVCGSLCFQYWNLQILNFTQILINKIRHLLSLRKLAIGFIGYFVLMIVLTIALQKSISLSNWNSSFPLLLGNEFSGDRPWEGQITSVCLSDRAVSQAEINQQLTVKNSCTGFNDSLLASYQFNGIKSYPDQTGNLPRLVWNKKPEQLEKNQGIHINENHGLKTTEPVTVLAEKLRKSNQFTLSLTLASANFTQTGPARILSISNSPLQRNLTLAQQNKDLIIRLRMPLTGMNGSRPEFLIPNVFTDPKFHQIILTFNQHYLQVYLDPRRYTVSIQLTPEITLFAFLSGVLGRSLNLITFNSLFYTVLYYLLIFMPLGTILGLIYQKMKTQSIFEELKLFCLGLVIPALLLEGFLVSGSHPKIQLENIFLSLMTAFIAMLSTHSLHTSIKHLSSTDSNL